MRIVASCPLYATEDLAKVEAAITSVIPGDVEHAADAVRVVSSDPGPLRRRIWELRIIDTFRAQLLEKTRKSDAEVHLDKQAAAGGKVSFPVGKQPLGTIHVHFLVEPGDPWDDAEAFAWWLCPETKDGQIVED